jgi:hypothetical protein
MTFLDWTHRPGKRIRPVRRCRPQVEALEQRLTPSFTPQATLAVGGQPYFVAAADFNGDGKPDLAVANSGGSTVSIRLGNGAGGFSAGPALAVGEEPWSVAVADFNGDGKLDLAVANQGSDNVSIRLGNGAGGFTPAPDLPISGAPNSVAAGDFNGDGKPDLAIPANGTVKIRLGDGAGGFTAAPDVVFTGGATPRSVVVADFNGDGKQDFAGADDAVNTVFVRLGNGAGGFTAAPDIGARGAYFVTAGDVNGDGKQDLVIAQGGLGNVGIRLGDGAGNFTPAEDIAPSGLPYSAAVGDFNGDGKLDLAISSSSATSGRGNVSIRLGDGAGGFTAAPDVAVGDLPDSVAVGDFNGDGRADLATANYGTNNVTVLLNAAPDPPVLTPTPTPPAPPAPSPPPRQIAAVVVRQKGVARVRVLDAATGAERGVLTPFAGHRGRLRLALRDRNGDGALDLVVQAVVQGKRRQRAYDAVTLAPLPPARP